MRKTINISEEGVLRYGFKNTTTLTPFSFTGSTSGNPDFWAFGSDNKMPYALAMLGRGVPIHRRILNDKRDYTLGGGFTYDEKNDNLMRFVERCNKSESLSDVIKKVFFDFYQGGNAYIEVVTNRKRSFLSFFHQDYTKCRLNKGKDRIILNSDWGFYNKTKSKELPIYPLFEYIDGYMRSIIVFKDYEPMYTNYGVPSYIAGMNVSAIAYKTDKWNISRLDNSFQLSGVMEVDADEEDSEAAAVLSSELTKKFAGTPGQVLFLVKNKVQEGRGSKFTAIDSANDGDWSSLHDSSNNDIIVAHSWFKELSGFDYTTGFSPERILYAYEIAKATTIRPIQSMVLSSIKGVMESILSTDCSSLDFINKPPITIKPQYMKVWEARKIDGLEYDEKDPLQNIYLSEMKNGTSNNSK